MRIFGVDVWSSNLILRASLIFSSFCFSQAYAYSIQGWIDTRPTLTNPVIGGWTCVEGSSYSITVSLYIGGPPGSGTLIGTYPAVNPSEPEVAAACGSTGSYYRYLLSLSYSMLENYSGQPIYVYGVAPGISGQLAQSGSFLVPTPGSVTNVMSFGATGNGTTDDSTAIQNAINATAAGGQVLFPPGTYMLGTSHGPSGLGNYPASAGGGAIASALFVPNPTVALTGTGSSSILMLMPHAKMRVVEVPTSSNNVTLRNLVVDGNKANRTGAPWPGGDVVDAMVYGWSALNITISGVETRNGIEDGVGCWQCTGVTVANSYSHDNGTTSAGATGISFSGSNGMFLGNTILNNSSAGIWTAYGTNLVQISNNTISRNIGAGLAIGGQGGTDQNYVITANSLTGNGVSGFTAISIVGATSGTITGNTIQNNFFNGISLNGGGGWQISGNTCAQNDISGGTGPADLCQ